MVESEYRLISVCISIAKRPRTRLTSFFSYDNLTTLCGFLWACYYLKVDDYFSCSFSSLMFFAIGVGPIFELCGYREKMNPQKIEAIYLHNACYRSACLGNLEEALQLLEMAQKKISAYHACMQSEMPEADLVDALDIIPLQKLGEKLHSAKKMLMSKLWTTTSSGFDGYPNIKWWGGFKHQRYILPGWNLLFLWESQLFSFFFLWIWNMIELFANETNPYEERWETSFRRHPTVVSEHNTRRHMQHRRTEHYNSKIKIMIKYNKNRIVNLCVTF